MPVNQPEDPGAQHVQGPGATGQEGFPVAIVGATGMDPIPVTSSGGGGGPATIADGADVAQGSTTDAAITTDIAGTTEGKLRGLVKILASVWDSVNGWLKVAVQGTVSVVQSGAWSVGVNNFPATQPVSGTVSVVEPVSVDDNGASLTVDGAVSIVGTVPVSATALPLPTGAATEATLATVLTTSDFDTKIGSLTEAAPASDTASSGLNGRLQRIAQRLTSLIALLPAALVSGRLDVNLGAAPATVTVTEAKPATATRTSVAASATVVTILGSNTARLGATIYNDSGQALTLALGSGASATSFTVQMAKNSYYEVPFGYTGIITGLWGSASGNARVTELT